MKKIFLSSLIALSSLTIYSNANAGFRASVALSPTSYELSNPTDGTAAAVSDYMAFGWNVTYALEKTYFSVAGSTSLDSSTEHDLYLNPAPFDRSEIAFTVGYPLTDSIAIFGGFRSSTSTYSNNTPLDSNRTMVFKASGLFAGASLGLPVGDNIALSLTAAGAFMSGTLDGFNIGNPAVDYNATADTTFGYSLSAAGSYFLSDSSGLGLKVSIQGYQYTGWSDPNYIIDDLDENIFAIGASYFMAF